MFEEKTIQAASDILQTDQTAGLSEKEAARRLVQNGPNELKGAKRRTPIEAFVEQLNDPLIYVLLAAAAISFFLGETSDALIILFVVGMNAFVGMMQEGKAQKALDSLKKLAQPHALVIRENREKQIAASTLVTGDLVCLEAGCQVPADLRLVEVNGLQVQEAALTGEAVPVGKQTAVCHSAKQKEIPLGDRHNMAYMSTVVTAGRGKGLVTATGMETQIGRIATLMQESREELTPLQKRLGELGKMLSLLSLGICSALFLLAVFQRRNVFDMLLTAISLAVAAVPEGLPAVVTLCLALSVTRMVKVNTIIRRLPSVETLGAVSVVCSDKTGTLTQNRMTVKFCFARQQLIRADQLDPEKNRELFRAMTLCNDGLLGAERIGDPTELALLELAREYGYEREALEERLSRKGELGFSSERKMMTTFHAGSKEKISYTKGAPDRVLARCSSILQEGQCVPLTEKHRQQIEAAQSALSARALRTLAFACRMDARKAEEQGLVFLGLAALEDPIRPEAVDAIETFRQAGVSTVMITGDHAETALAIGRQLGIAADKSQCLTGEQIDRLSEEAFLEALSKVRIFARVSPAHKVRIVKGFQQKGNVVAMTGDGVNDAPSLKAADVGVAMGKNGTDVARQASDLILTDDNFATIQKAIQEGRGVYENIKKSVIFLLSSNLGEILTMFCAVLLGLASPLKSGHILWINLITDSLPALALGVDKNDGKSLMERPPRKAEESLFAGGGLTRTVFYGVLIAGISLTAFFTLPWQVLARRNLAFSVPHVAALLQDRELLLHCQTYAFTVLGMSQLFHAVGMRDVHRSLFRMNHRENKLMLLACAVGFLLQLAVTGLPFLNRAFQTTRLGAGEWLYLAGLAAFPLLAHELFAYLDGPDNIHRVPDRQTTTHRNRRDQHAAAG